MSKRGNHARREARRQRDAEWVKLQLTVLRLMGEPNTAWIERTCYTKGLMQALLRSRYNVTDLTSKKQTTQPPQPRYPNHKE